MWPQASRPAFSLRGAVRLFSGFFLVISEKVEPVAVRRLGVYGL